MPIADYGAYLVKASAGTRDLAASLEGTVARWVLPASVSSE